MPPSVPRWMDLPRLLPSYKRRAPLILVNGLAEQPESWFANRAPLARHFDVKVPEILVYDGDALHERIESGEDVTVDYLADRLAVFLDQFVQRAPYHLVASSLGCQVVLTYAVRNPEKVAKLALICPSGFYGDESLPAMEGVKRSQYDTLVKSVFHQGRFASDGLVEAFERKFQNRKWKKGVLRTLRGTVGHSVNHLLPRVTQPSLVIWGADDQVLSDVAGSIRAARQMADVRQVVIPRCGHAPQIEKARLVNQLVSRYLRDKLKNIPPDLDPEWFLENRNPPRLRTKFALPSPLLRAFS
ncbi:MAG: alpha/beta fold hydrolase [Paludisphaera borealis]|uniref:alpha/beta fold hydrolase n=1 Tax=Paludisphaera borealis TaxID=1387353 RepID=UPI00283C9EE9|nr:alpha/beta fold hydrolase [Paludisphaera borealis]MDR3618108.1 alpha/beta fold hydrolase [Paludisphaera borealis]